MKNVRMVIQVVVLAIFAASCSKNEELSPYPPLEVWTQPTQGSVTAEIDDVSFSKNFKGTMATSNAGKFIVTTNEETGKQKLSVTVYDETTKNKIDLAVVDFKGIGTYPVMEVDTTLSKERELKEANFISYSTTKLNKEYSWNNFTDTKEIKEVGTIAITKFNVTTKEVEGTFESTVTTKINTQVSTKSITKGQFSGTFAVMNF